MTVVQKYGGTSVGSVERLRNVAHRVATRATDGERLAVVVSAMGKTTDDLLSLAREVNPRPPRRETDLLMATGEMVSSALLTMALVEMGCPAVALTGAQAGMFTDDSFGRARIRGIDTWRVEEEFSEGHVVVVAGFQGQSPQGDYATLGRGGSDTSAVALGAALRATQVEIYTDVEGIYTTDPRIEPNARCLRDIASEEMLEAAQQGAGVMHPRAVELGLLYDIPILVASSQAEFGSGRGTLIHREVQMEPENRVRTIALDRDVASVTLRHVPDRPGIAAQLFGPLADAGISVDTIVQNASELNLTDLTFTVSKDDCDQTEELSRPLASELGAADVLFKHDLVKVSLIGTGMQSGPGYAATMFRSLSEAGINIELITTSEIRITCLVQSERGEEAVRVLHSAFHLDEEI
ncbi:MAG: aspartate kinase [Chloroflexi bacterium]|nr:aspartate kinase [Chloroflexota bacterium]MCY3588142.1 aspartate kinase [Chloroflexota bacterium]MDE2707946.1 aspartate kinase [Chloroflexota bacterium]MXV81568.1 aspartate kinase [Chloroflexota bacterium]MYC02322.1 aspartate kinase [Chloroflexota bacterium]